MNFIDFINFLKTQGPWARPYKVKSDAVLHSKGFLLVQECTVLRAPIIELG